MHVRHITILIGFSVLIGGTYALSPQIRVPLHFTLSQFLHGVSAGKMIYALAMLVAMTAGVALRRRPGPTERKWIWRSWTAGVWVGMSLCFATHWVYTRHFGLTWSWHSFHWRDGLNSVNSVAHIHTSKVAIAQTLDLLGLSGWHRCFDTGAAYLEVIPAALSLTLGFLFLVTTLLGGWLFVRHVRRYPARQRGLIALLAALGLATLSKGMFDGGPLAYDTVAAALLLWLIANARSVRGLACAVGSNRRLGLLLVGLWLSVLASIDAGMVMDQTYRFAYRAALYALLISAAWGLELRHMRRRKRITEAAVAAAARRGTSRTAAAAPLGPRRERRSARLTLTASAVLVASFAAQQARIELLPLYEQAPRLANVYTCLVHPFSEEDHTQHNRRSSSTLEAEPPGLAAARPSSRRITESLGIRADSPLQGGDVRTTVIPGGATCRAAYQQCGDDPQRSRFVSLHRDALPAPNGFIADLIVLDTTQTSVVLQPEGLVEINGVRRLPDPRYLRLHARIQFDAVDGPVLWRPGRSRQDQLDENERFVAYHLLDAYLRRAGISEYILIPYAQFTLAHGDQLAAHTGDG
jgi:hypothetical protein